VTHHGLAAAVWDPHSPSVMLFDPDAPAHASAEDRPRIGKRNNVLRNYT
jgi:hypothetical protein